MGAMMAAQALGLEPNTLLGHAFLIPYAGSRPKMDENGQIMKQPDGKWIWEDYIDVQFQIGYKGFVALFRRSGRIIHIDTEAIRENDVFEHAQGSEAFLKYQKKLANRGELIGSFCYTRILQPQMPAGYAESATVLPLDEILKIRDASQTYRKLVENVEKAQEKGPRAVQKAEQKLAQTPWVLWPDVMFAKSACKRHSKVVDLGNAALAAAAEIDSAGDAGTMDLGAFTDPDLTKSVIDGQPIPEEEPETSQEGFTPVEKEEENKQEWPQLIAHPELGQVWADSQGKHFNKEIHSWSRAKGMPSVKADGTFRDRRGTHQPEQTAKPAEKPAEKKQEGGPMGDEPPPIESGFSEEGLE